MNALLDHLGPFLLVAFRLSGVMLAAPLLASGIIPGKIRVLLVGMLALAVYPALPARVMPAETLDVFTLGWLGAGEVFIGFVIGLIAMLPIAAVQLAGLVMGLQMGFGLAAIVNPALETETEPIGELLSYVALYIFMLVGGLESTFLAVCRTFAHTPPGAFSEAVAPVNLFTGVLASGTELAMRVSLPLMGIVMMETVASAFVAKTIPTINIQSLGFAVKIAIGLGALLLGLHAIDEAVTQHTLEVLRRMLFWAADPRGG